jgi:SAM-dependent methyltransferase
MDELELLVDLHIRNERQGPGSADDTRRALALAGIQPDRQLSIADVGCGTGASALVLAQDLGAPVRALDMLPAFVDAARVRAEDRGLADLVHAEVARMEELPIEPGSLDLLWSEGAIYNMGFAEGVCAWRSLLKPGGVLAVSDLTWTTPARPADVDAHWNAAYPGVALASEKIRILEDAGYAPLGFFFLPPSSWDAYYGPLRAGVPAFRARHGASAAAEAILAEEEKEQHLYAERGEWFSYGFFVARRFDGA